MTERIWFCKVGGEADFFEKGADLTMHRAIAKAFREVIGRDPEFTFSGWGQELTEGERAVVENREPKMCEIDHPHFYACKYCGIGPTTPGPDEPPVTAKCLNCGHTQFITEPRMSIPVPPPAIRNLATALLEQRGVGWSVVLCFLDKTDAEDALRGFDQRSAPTKLGGET